MNFNERLKSKSLTLIYNDFHDEWRVYHERSLLFLGSKAKCQQFMEQQSLKSA